MYLCFLNIEINIIMLLFSCSHTLLSTILFFIHPFAGLLEEISFEISSAFVLKFYFTCLFIAFCMFINE